MFGKRLGELRRSKGLKQQDLAKMIPVSQSSIGMWESEKREPNLETIRLLADFFDVTTDYLLGKSDNPDSSYQEISIPKGEVLTDKEIECIKLYRDIPPTLQETALAILGVLNTTMDNQLNQNICEDNKI